MFFKVTQQKIKEMRKTCKISAQPQNFFKLLQFEIHKNAINSGLDFTD